MEEMKKHVAHIESRFSALEVTIAQNVTKLVTDLHASTIKTKSEKIWDFLLKAAVPTVVAIGTFVLSLDRRVSFIESTRITSVDFQKTIGVLQLELQKASQGPDWLRNEIVSINVKMDLLKENMAKMSERVARVEAEMKK